MSRSVDAFSNRSLKTFNVDDLTGRRDLPIGTVSGVVDRIGAAGRPSKERPEQERRIVRLHLTLRGRAVLQRTPDPPTTGSPVWSSG